MLEATSFGLGSTRVMCFDPEIIRKEYHLPKNRIPVAIVVIGYSIDDSKPSPSHSEYRQEKENIFYHTF